MRMGRLLSAAAVVCALGVSSMAAQATTYSQAINESGPGLTFDRIDAFIFAPNGNLALSSFSDSSWDNTAKTTRWSVAAGNASSNLTFNTTFDLTDTLPIFYDFFAFLDGDIVDSARFTLDSGKPLSVIDPLTDPVAIYAADVAQAVPEPGTLALLGPALLALGFLALRRRGTPISAPAA